MDVLSENINEKGNQTVHHGNNNNNNNNEMQSPISEIHAFRLAVINTTEGEGLI